MKKIWPIKLALINFSICALIFFIMACSADDRLADTLYISDVHAQDLWVADNTSLHTEDGSPLGFGGGGTVTQIDTGTGLTGGPITTNGTISIDNTVVTLAGVQELTNKTVTSPVFQGTVSAGTGLTMPTFSLPNNARLKLQTTDGVPRDCLIIAIDNSVHLKSYSNFLKLQENVSQDILLWTDVQGGTRVFYILPVLATAGAPLQDSQYFRQRSRYWDGSATKSWDFDVYHDITATTPTSHVDFRINSADILTLQNDNGTLSMTTNGSIDHQANYIQLSEMTAPGAGAADTARIYADQGGDGLTDLNAVFQDGTVDTFAQETTDLNSPIFTQPSGTEVKYVMMKPHPGLVQFVAQFPDGQMFVLRQIEYHDADKITANKGAERPLPKDWVVTTATDRVNKATEDPTKVTHDNTGQGILTKEQNEEP